MSPRSVPRAFFKEHADLVTSLSLSHGRIQNVFPSGKFAPHRPVVIHIQDVHGNFEAQWNIRQTVQALIDRNVVGLVALEGAFGTIDLSRYRAFPNHETIGDVADYLLKKNKISGPVHAGFTSVHPIPPFVGIDDPRHYRSNVEAYRASAIHVKSYKSILAKIKADVDQRKSLVYNAALYEFDRQMESYRGGSLPLKRYVTILSGNVSEKYISKSVQNFIEVLQREKDLDLKQVEEDRTRLMAELPQKLGHRQIGELVQSGEAYRTGQMNVGEFYRFFRTFCESNGVPINTYPALASYVNYALQTNEIDADTLFNDLIALEKFIYEQRAKSDEEKSMVAESKRVDLAGKLINFSLTPKEWMEYTVLQDSGKSLESGVLDLSSFEDFYKEAHARDLAMSDNLQIEMERNKTDVAVLITGGHHSPGITKRLTKAGMHVVRFIPKIDKIDSAQNDDSLRYFTRDQSPLENLFGGDRLFLAAPPASLSVLEGEARIAVVGIEEIKNGPVPLVDAQTLSNILGDQAVQVETIDVVPTIADVSFSGMTYRIHRPKKGVLEIETQDSITDMSSASQRFYSRIRRSSARDKGNVPNRGPKPAAETELDQIKKMSGVYRILNTVSQQIKGGNEDERASIARGVAQEMGSIPNVPPDLLGALAEGLKPARGDTLRNLSNALIQGLGKTKSPAPDLIGKTIELIRSTDESELMYMSHGLWEGVQKAKFVSPDILMAMGERLRTLEGENLIAKNFLDRAISLGVMKTKGPSLALDQIEWVEKQNSVSSEELSAVVSKFKSEKNDSLEDLTRLWVPRVCRLFFAPSESIVLIEEKVSQGIGRLPRFHETTYF
ncbi:MAG: hypothetical protein IPN90_07890 [Elusimicrobia bacterium]|nr:hypothetical protein [Elusimicrobiota bacterium]